MQNFDFNKLENIEIAYTEKYHKSLFNVSHWDPDKRFFSVYNLKVQIPSFCLSPFQYCYTTNFQPKLRNEVIRKLGYNEINQKDILITHSSSNTILNTLLLLMKKGIKKIYIINPSYFSVEECCKILQIDFVIINIKRERNNTFSIVLPNIEIDSAIWFTNPIYNTSVYFDENFLSKIENILTLGHLVVCDESLCLHGNELSHRFGSYRNFVGIYCPHKSICLNSFKFSGLVFDIRDFEIVNYYSDILSGGFGASTYQAVNHFLSSDFDIFSIAFHNALNENYIKLKQITKNHNVFFDECANGYFITIYFKEKNKVKISEDYFTELSEKTNTIFIPSEFNNFFCYDKLSFRINLTRISNENIHILIRLINYLSC